MKLITVLYTPMQTVSVWIKGFAVAPLLNAPIGISSHLSSVRVPQDGHMVLVQLRLHQLLDLFLELREDLRKPRTVKCS